MRSTPQPALIGRARCAAIRCVARLGLARPLLPEAGLPLRTASARAGHHHSPPFTCPRKRKKPCVLPHYHAYPLHVAVFTDVTNAAHLRRQLLEANPDYDYAFLDASMILSLPHLLSAAFLALHSTLTQRAKTRTPHSELVFRLSPNNNIGEAYRTFGLTDATRNLIAVKMGGLDLATTQNGLQSPQHVTRESVSRHLSHVVSGVQVEIGEEEGPGVGLGRWCDVERVRKVYKVGVEKGKGKGKGKGAAVVHGGVDDGRDEWREVESVVLGIMALKGS